MFDYKAIAYQYGINDDKTAKRIFAKAMDITRKLAGDLPQNTLEKQFPKELMDNYQDLLQMQDKGKYRESLQKENKLMKNKTKIREYLESDMTLDELIEGYNLNEEETYSQSMINPNTVKGKDVDEECGKSKKKKEYANDSERVNTGDLEGENGYGSSYAPEGENAYGIEDDKNEILKAETAYDEQGSVGNGEDA